jgi:hypothetical protein
MSCFDTNAFNSPLTGATLVPGNFPVRVAGFLGDRFSSAARFAGFGRGFRESRNACLTRKTPENRVRGRCSRETAAEKPNPETARPKPNLKPFLMLSE